MVGYQQLEDKILRIFTDHIGENINLPESLKRPLGLSSTKISAVDSNISKQHNSKTDLLVVFDDGNKLKISIKKDNADYYGNWYTHQRIEEEFGKPALTKLIEKTTEWANYWIKQDSSNFFLGVSINFGERSGKTFMEFNEIFTLSDIKSIVQGHDLSLDTSANALLQTSGSINSIDEIIAKLVLFEDSLLNTLFQDIKIVFRPINPMTEGSNRGKQTYTKFVPHEKLLEKETISTKNALINMGVFKQVDLNKEYKLNHNRLIADLDETYNVEINVKT